MHTGRMGTVLRLLGIGWYVALCIIGGGIGGIWLDRWLDTGPALTLTGILVGVAAAVVGMYRMLMAVLSAPAASVEQDKEQHSVRSSQAP